VRGEYFVGDEVVGRSCSWLGLSTGSDDRLVYLATLTCFGPQPSAGEALSSVLMLLLADAARCRLGWTWPLHATEVLEGTPFLLGCGPNNMCSWPPSIMVGRRVLDWRIGDKIEAVDVG